MDNESVTAYFGKFPTCQILVVAKILCRYGAAMLSNDEWIVWNRARASRSADRREHEPASRATVGNEEA